MHHKQLGGQVRGQVRDELQQGLDAPRRESDYDDVVPRHTTLLPAK
jgi:hypothetical protein